MKPVWKLSAMVMVLLTLAGCASPGSGQSTRRTSFNQPVSLDFILVETSSPLPDLAAEKRSLSDAVVSGLRETELFTRVSANPADVTSGNGVKLRVEITAIKKVSDNSRVWFGALAGRARIAVRATFTDLPSGRKIEVVEVAGESGDSAKSGTTDEAIQQVAGQIVAEAVRLNAQTGP